MAEVLFFLAAIGAVAGAVGTVSLRNPFYAVLALVCHLLALAALFLLLYAQFVAAAQVVVYAGAVMVLYVFVVAYVGGGAGEPLTGSTGVSLRFASILFALALFAELTIALVGTGLTALETEGATLEAELRDAGRGRRAVPHEVPGGVRDRLAPAADRRRGRGDPGPPARRAGRRRRDLGGRRDAPAGGDRRPGRAGVDDRGGGAAAEVAACR